MSIHFFPVMHLYGLHNHTTILGHCHVIWEPKLPGTLWAPRTCNGTDLPLPYCSGYYYEFGRERFVVVENGLFSVRAEGWNRILK